MNMRETEMHEKFKRRRLEVAGIRAFESRDEFYQWLNEPCRALGGKIPAKVAETDEGFEEVLKLLGRIEYGVYS